MHMVLIMYVFVRTHGDLQDLEKETILWLKIRENASDFNDGTRKNWLEKKCVDYLPTKELKLR